jgi:hypothetical protein
MQSQLKNNIIAVGQALTSYTYTQAGLELGYSVSEAFAMTITPRCPGHTLKTIVTSYS